MRAWPKKTHFVLIQLTRSQKIKLVFLSSHRLIHRCAFASEVPNEFINYQC